MQSFRSIYASCGDDLNIQHCAFCIVGESSDDRGDAAISFCGQKSNELYVLTYNAFDLQYTLKGIAYEVDNLEPLTELFKIGFGLCDTTTLGFVETLLCLRAFKEAKSPKIGLLYIEPENYAHERTAGVLHKRDFSLTDRSQVFGAVPGSVIMVTGARRCKAAAFVGYEGDRLQQFLEQNNIPGKLCTVIYGVPAFNSGWESNAFANTVQELHERGVNSVLFAGATNPMAAYDSIKRLYQGVHGDEGLLIVPIGTKPHGIGAALFACDHETVGLVYDHPQKKKGRTGGVGTWNLYLPVF